jgi:dipeptidyl aminopeptidase/acylaminoacyl peptidase
MDRCARVCGWIQPSRVDPRAGSAFGTIMQVVIWTMSLPPLAGRGNESAAGYVLCPMRSGMSIDFRPTCVTSIPLRSVDEARITAAMLAGGRELSEPRVSPDGRTVAYTSAAHGRGGLVVQPVDGGPERIVTTEPAPRTGRWDGGGCFDWMADGRGFVYAARDGDLWSVRVDGGAPRRVTAHSEAAPAEAPAVSPDGTRVAYVDDTRHVRVVSSDGGEAVELSDAEFCLDPSWSADGRFVVWHEWDAPNMPWDVSRLAARRADAGEPVIRFDPGAQVQQPRFGPAGRDLAFLCDADGWLTLWRAGRDAPSGHPLSEAPYELGGPSWGHGQRSYAWSPDGRTLAFCRNESGFGRLCTADVATGEVTERAKGWHAGLSWRGETLVAVRSGARTPTQIVAYATSSWDRRVLAVGPVFAFDDPSAPEPTAVSWPAEDGTEIPGRLYASGSAGLLLWVHGGPTGQATVAFNPRFAYWLARGWSILVPDHRGSAGHGRAFTQALCGRWGEVDVADCAAGARAALARGWAAAGRIVVTGGSAGGFTALNLVLHHPDVVAAAVVSYPVSDLAGLGAATHRFERHYNDRLIGRRPAADTAYRERSPLTHAARLRRPLLVFHGTDDPVVPVTQSRALVSRARAAGCPAELVEFEGEGHGLRQDAHIAEELARTEAFLAGDSSAGGR